jgi:hypothetical protein
LIIVQIAVRDLSDISAVKPVRAKKAMESAINRRPG